MLKWNVEKILQQASTKCEQAEVYLVDSSNRTVSFEANRLKEILQRATSGVALRVIGNGRVGLTSSTDPRHEGELVGNAVTMSEFGPKAGFDFPDAHIIPEIATVDNAVTELTAQQMTHTAQTLIEKLRARCPEALCDAIVRESSATVRILNSAGTTHEMRATGYSVLLAAQIIKGTDLLHVWSGHSSCQTVGEPALDELVLQPVALAIERAQNTVAAPPAGTPVVFTPKGLGATILHPLLEGFNGTNVATRNSPLQDRWGMPVVSNQITVIDNPLITMNSEARPFDDEGMPSQKTVLIDEGRAVSPLLDLKTAAELGMVNTASARRSLAGVPSPATSAIEIASGKITTTELMQGKVLIVEDLLGAGQGNALGGDFTANVSLGYLAENGEIVGRVKNTMIAGNAYKVLSSVEGISTEREWVFGSLLAPSLRVGGVNIAGAA